MTLIRMTDAVTGAAAVCRGPVATSPRTDDVAAGADLAAGAAGAADRTPPRPGSAPLQGLRGPRTPADAFAPAPVHDGQVLGLLDRAWRIHRSALPQGPTGADALAVIVHRPAAVGRGGDLYAAGAASTVVEMPRLPPLTGLYMDAPLLLLVCGDVRRVSDSTPTSGYPALLSAAGALGHVLWLTALSAGLGGRIFTSGCRPATTAVRRHHPGMRHLLTVAVGHVDGRDT